MRRNVFLLSSCLFLLLLAPLALASSSAAPPCAQPPETDGPWAAGEGPLHSCLPLGWAVETVDGSFGAGWFTSLELDVQDWPHISYYDNSAHYLRYAFYDGSAWHIETPDPTWVAGLYSSLALDSLDRPHIAYYGGSGNLKYAVLDGGAWLIEEVDSSSDVGYYPSLALDAAGAAQVACFDWALEDLRYARRAGTTDQRAWDIQIVDSTGHAGEYPSMALDANGYPRVSYYANHDLRYAAFDGTAWVTETVDRGGVSVVGFDTSLALDAAGRPHISYYAYTSGDLRYAHHDGTRWVTVTLDSAGLVGEYTSLALDAAGRPRISYYDHTNGALKYACFDGSAWQIQTVDSSGGMFTSLELDAAGKPHISYKANSHLMYAHAVDVWADFAWGPPTPTARLPVLFAATVTGTAPFSLTWDLGDGSFVAGPSALVHTYAAAGAYTVTLAATNGIGETYTARHRLAVLPGYSVYLGLVVR